MEENPIITIPKCSDAKLGYLNNSYVYKFTLDGKTWPSVERYMLAKKFEGTVLEEEIRTAKNDFISNLMANPKRIILEENGSLIKKYVYGSNNCCVSNHWQTTQEENMRNSVRAKFQSKLGAALIKTDGIKIVDAKSKILGPILMEIRDELLQEKKIVKKARTISYPNLDMKDKKLTREEINLIGTLSKNVEWIREMERNTEIQLSIETIEDSFCNYFDSISDESLEEAQNIIRVIKEWTSHISGIWENVVKNMPNFERLVEKVKKILNNAKNNTVINSIFIAAIIRWLRMDASLEENEIFFFRVKVLRKSDFVLPPIKRKYRK